MNLYERLQARQQPTEEVIPRMPVSPAPLPTITPEPASHPTPQRPGEPAKLAARLPSAPAPVGPRDAMSKLKANAVETLFERLGTRLNDPNLDEAALQALVVTELNQIVEESRVPLSAVERKRLIRGVQDDVLGFGPLEPLLADAAITEIMVNGPDKVYIEEAGQISQVPIQFDDEDHLRRVIDRIVTRVGRRIDESSPLVDARLADGSRVNAIIPPLAFSGSTLTIRKFSTEALSVPDLIRLGTLSPEMAELLHACVQARLNVIISGGTGTGNPAHQ